MTDTKQLITPRKDILLTATTPQAMTVVQADLIAWCDARIAEEQAEKVDAVENRDLAKKNKWRVEPWLRRVRRHQQRLTYYQKLKFVLEQGYYIIPPLPCELFAIRTNNAGPRGRGNDNEWSALRENAGRLPIGEGRYVSPTPAVGERRWSENQQQRDGTTKAIQKYWQRPICYQDVDFPFTAVRSELLHQVVAAMEMNAFDQLGIVQQSNGISSGTRGDPIVVGQLLPAVNQSWGSKAPTTFFIGWWLNTADL